jgi:CHAD domain-containing protein
VTSDSAPVEVELKYRLVAPLDIDTIVAYAAEVGLVAEGDVEKVPVRDVYVDTAGGRLGHDGVAARIRHRPDGVRVTVKTPAVRRGAMVRRTELEHAATPSLDPADWPASPARDAVVTHAHGEPLIETVTLEQVRRVVVVGDASARIELSLDDVSVIAGGDRIDHFGELEAELVSGDEAALHRLSARIESDPAVTIGGGSKLHRAMEAVAAAGLPVPRPFVADADRALDPETATTEQPTSEAAQAAAEEATLDREVERVMATMMSPAPGAPTDSTTPEGGRAEAGAVSVVAVEPSATESAEQIASPPHAPTVASIAVKPPGKTPGVLGDDAFAEAGRKVLRFHFAKMLAKEEGTRIGADPEDLHDMRVATRRQRAAWRVFGSGFRPGRARRMKSHLREVGTRLGAVRDLDVLIEALRAYQAEQTQAERDGLEALVESWEAERDDARVLLVRELDSAGYRHWVTTYTEFVLSEGLGTFPPLSPTSPYRVRDMAGSRLWLAYEDVRAYEHTLRWADLATLHELRIAAKRLRYAIEFFREALGPDTAVIIPKVVALQDHLGYLHDAEVTAGRARAFLVENSGRLSEAEIGAVGRYLSSREKELVRLRRSVGRPWRAVIGPPFRRGLARAIADL